MNSYKELIYWQRSMDLAVLVYKYTGAFPREELYGMVSQMRRCSVSIPSNIAEGWARKNTGEYTNFLSVANGSAAELETQLMLCERLNLGDSKLRGQCLALDIEIQKMLYAAIRSLKKS